MCVCMCVTFQITWTDTGRGGRKEVRLIGDGKRLRRVAGIVIRFDRAS